MTDHATITTVECLVPQPKKLCLAKKQNGKIIMKKLVPMSFSSPDTLVPGCTNAGFPHYYSFLFGIGRASISSFDISKLLNNAKLNGKEYFPKNQAPALRRKES